MMNMHIILLEVIHKCIGAILNIPILLCKQPKSNIHCETSIIFF